MTDTLILKIRPKACRQFWRDEFIRRASTTAHALEGELAQLKDIQAKTSSTNAYAEIEKTIALHDREARNQIISRLQAMARTELSAYHVVIEKLHLIEAEVIQRMYLASNIKADKDGNKKFVKTDKTLIFPYSDELWIDEVDSYHSQVKSCPRLKEATL